MPTDPDIVEARKVFVRKLLARALYPSEVVAACGQSKLFRNQSGKRLEPGTIKTEYVYAVQRDLKAGVAALNGEEELAKSLERLHLAYRIAAAANDVKGMVAAQRVLNRMLGLRKPLIDQDPEIVEDPAEISEAMDDSVGTPDEDD